MYDKNNWNNQVDESLRERAHTDYKPFEAERSFVDILVFALFRPSYLVLLLLTFLVLPAIAEGVSSVGLSDVLKEASDGYVLRLLASWVILLPYAIALSITKRVNVTMRPVVALTLLPAALLFQVSLVGGPDTIIYETRAFKNKANNSWHQTINQTTDHIMDEAERRGRGLGIGR